MCILLYNARDAAKGMLSSRADLWELAAVLERGRMRPDFAKRNARNSGMALKCHRSGYLNMAYTRWYIV